MSRENVTKFDLAAAFKELDSIDIPVPSAGRVNKNTVNLKETFNNLRTRKNKTDILLEEYFDITDQNELEAAQETRDEDIAQAKLARIEKIVDLDATSPEDILPSYAGKTIIQCPQCMNLFFKDPADIEYSDDLKSVNVGEKCQHCGNENGYDIIGKVAPAEEEVPAEEPVVEDPLNAEEEEVPEAEENEEELEAEDEEPAEDLDLDLEDEEDKNESLNLSKQLKDAAKNSALETENHSDNLTLNEDVEDVENTNNTDTEDEAKINNYTTKENVPSLQEIARFGDATFKVNKDGTTTKVNESLELTEDEEVSNSDFEKLIGSSEFAKPVTDAEIEKIFAETNATNEALEPEAEFDFNDLDDLDETSITECLTISLTEVYDNVKSFSLSNCSINDNKLVVEGLINFNSGKAKKTTYVFENAQSVKNTVTATGFNEMFGKNTSFELQAVINSDTKSLVTERLTYKYNNDNGLFEGLVKKN